MRRKKKERTDISHHSFTSNILSYNWLTTDVGLLFRSLPNPGPPRLSPDRLTTHTDVLSFTVSGNDNIYGYDISLPIQS